MRNPMMLLVPASALVLAVAGCQSDGPRAAQTLLSPAAIKEVPLFPGKDHFVPEITNPYLNFAIGRTFHYRSETEAGTEINTVLITGDKKMIEGVSTTVVHDQVRLNGDLTEDTFDWIAQDDEGNVWYFGEDTKEYENGQVVTTAGSWEAGVNGEPGILMLAEPEVGQRYKQEDSPDNAEDMAKIVSLCAPVEVEYGDFDCALLTAEWSLVESGPRDAKYYVRDVGMVLESGGRGTHLVTSELTAID